MSRRKGPTPPQDWGDWHEVEGLVNRLSREPVNHNRDIQRIVQNNRYLVIITRIEPNGNAGAEAPTLIWLSIRRQDRKVVRDWRDLQRIKNELVGPECEGMEMYPAESRLVDTSNQFHLWVFEDPTVRFPWGYDDRLVLDADVAAAMEPGAVQRPFGESA